GRSGFRSATGSRGRAGAGCVRSPGPAGPLCPSAATRWSRSSDLLLELVDGGVAEFDDLLLRDLAADELPGDLPFAQDDDAVAEHRELLDVGRDHDGPDAALGEIADGGVDLLARADVDAARRLVEEDHLDAGQQPSGDDGLLLVAA